MESACKGKVLLVGDGDFSFSLSLLRHFELDARNVFTSNIESPETIQQHQQAAHNMAALQELGATVLLEVDATDLHSHPTVSQFKFDRVIFNFPLADRFNIKKNRSLIGDFFTSCGSILTEEGQVMVTLCKGQGGTPADEPMRSWHNSWQVVAMATNAGFSLVQVEPFDSAKYPEYNSVGFRFQDKSFNNSGAITHTFERLPMAEHQPLPPRGRIHCQGQTYSCSSRVLQKSPRNLLLETTNPVSMTRQALLDALSPHFSLTVNDCNNLIVEGYQSFVTFEPSETNTSQISASLTSLNEQNDTEQMSEKDRKEDFNKKQQQIRETSHNDTEVKDLNLNGTLNNVKHLLPVQSESVFSAVKCSTQSSDVNGIQHSNEEIDNAITDVEMTDCSSQVFHVRSSLLEELRNLDIQNIFQTRGVSSEMKENGMECGNDDFQSDGKENSFKVPPECLVFSGQSFQPCVIHPQASIAKHEMLFICRADSEAQSNSTEICEESSASKHSHLNSRSYDTSTTLIDKLLCSQIFSGVKLQINSSDGESELKIKNFDSISNLGTVQFISPTKKSPNFGFIFNCAINGEMYEFCLINANILTSAICSLPNMNLLWSNNKKFSQQFDLKGFPQKFYPFSLYPMQFVHELNFSLKDPTSTLDESELMDAIGCVASDLIIKVDLKEMSEDATSGQKCYCYRLYFLSYDRALPYSTSWSVQSAVRLEVARRLGVVLK